MRYVFTKISAHLPSNQTHERKTNVFEGVARVNNNNVRRNTISENLSLMKNFQISRSWNPDQNMNLIQCQGIDLIEVNTGWRDCDYNERRKQVKNMHEIYEKCAL
jgi:hypothetical protein